MHNTAVWTPSAVRQDVMAKLQKYYDRDTAEAGDDLIRALIAWSEAAGLVQSARARA